MATRLTATGFGPGKPEMVVHPMPSEGTRILPPLDVVNLPPHPPARAASGDLFGSFVRDVMTRKVVSVLPGDSLRLAATLLSEKGISGMPVVDSDGVVVGVLSEKDIVRSLRQKTGLTLPGGLFQLILENSEARQKDMLTRCRAALDEVRVSAAMTSPAHTVTPNTLTLEAARLMLSLHINRMPVVENGMLVGIITRTNVLALYHGQE
jgi:CBS domain-containing protein